MRLRRLGEFRRSCLLQCCFCVCTKTRTLIAQLTPLLLSSITQSRNVSFFRFLLFIAAGVARAALPLCKSTISTWRCHKVADRRERARARRRDELERDLGAERSDWWWWRLRRIAPRCTAIGATTALRPAAAHRRQRCAAARRSAPACAR